MTLTKDDRCFYHGGTTRLYGMEGNWEVFYFHTPEDATAFNTNRCGGLGMIMETTQGQIWRVAIRL